MTIVSLVVQSPDRTPRHGGPVTCGVPWARGSLRDARLLELRDAKGHPAPLQARALNFWPDGSVRWTLLDWLADVDSEGSTTYHAAILDAAPEPATGLRIIHEAEGLTVDTGAARFRLSRGGPFPFEEVTVGGIAAIDPARTKFVVEDGRGRRHEPRIRGMTIFEPGPLRGSVRMEGPLAGPGGPLARFAADLHFFAGSATVRFDLTLHNPRRAIHPRNLWDLGAGGSIDIRDASLTIAPPAGGGMATIRCSPEPGMPLRDFGGGVELYQGSSGGDNWQSAAHINRRRVVPNTFHGYRICGGGVEEAGLRATPVVVLERDDQVLAVALEYFWQEFPKAIEATDDALTLRLFPHQYADVHELQGGEQKGHTFHVAFGRDPEADDSLCWGRAPLRARAEPAWYAASGAVGYLTPKAEDPSPEYLELVDSAIEGPDTFERKRGRVDEYGWRHFGELYADHEAAFHDGPRPLVSHYNNQYDVVNGCALQFLRSGDWRWWTLMHELARHVIDIDIYHTDGDKSAYNHGLFWHTAHYIHADTGTHRAYPHAAGIPGGGPSGGHCYATGLLLHYFLTGDPRSRDAVSELANWVVAMDDGRRTVFRWLAGGDTGHATSSAADYHGPGRAPANSINTLLDGHILDGDPAFQSKAELIIRRCIHPADDIAARNLPDVERRWFYTMFLQALGRYLDHKAERRQLDRMYAYARASLLHYARWMIEHEYPYLDKPEILEYPTETWAAQDMRKSEVFYHAARHADGPERDRFLERAEFFFRVSTETMRGKGTRSLARPVALLLSNGLMRAFHRRHPDATAPPPTDPAADFGGPEVFEPQKARALRRFKAIAGGGLLVIAALVAAVALRLMR